MLDGASADLHRIGIAVQPSLHGVQYAFVLPAPDPAEAGGRALGMHRAIATAVARVAVQDLSVVDAVGASAQDLACRAAVLVGLLVEDEVGLAEASLCLADGGHGLGDEGLYASRLGVEYLRALVVTPVSDQADALAPESLLRLAGHRCQGRAVVADFEHLVRDDEVVRGVRGDLHVVAHDAGAPAAGGHGPGIGVGL